MKLAAVFGAIAGFSALIIATIALSQSGSTSSATTLDPTASVAETRLDVELGDIFIQPHQLTALADSNVVLDVKNTGAIQHDLRLDGGDGTPMLNPGEAAALDLGILDEGVYVLYCTVPGHREGGMTAELAITHDAAAAGDHGTGERMLHNDDAYMAGVQAFPAATEGLGGQPMEPVMDGDVKVFELTARETLWEVEPGVWREAMAYNDQVPGPEIRVGLGERIRIVFNNELPESSAIHFHGLVVPYTEDGVPGLTQPLVLPGETYVYEFTTRNTGSHMYHSHMNGSVQIPMGLLGALIVEDGTEEQVDQDIVMILNDGPLGYTINGKGFPATAPIVANVGDRIRIRYMNEGLQIHPMHLHGMPQLVVAKDGYNLPQPHFEDTVTVAPGERWDVIVDVTEAGLWAFHCHILTHAEGPNGMFGMVTVFIVNE